MPRLQYGLLDSDLLPVAHSVIFTHADRVLRQSLAPPAPAAASKPEASAVTPGAASSPPAAAAADDVLTGRARLLTAVAAYNDAFAQAMHDVWLARKRPDSDSTASGDSGREGFRDLLVAHAALAPERTLAFLSTMHGHLAVLPAGRSPSAGDSGYSRWVRALQGRMGSSQRLRWHSLLDQAAPSPADEAASAAALTAAADRAIFGRVLAGPSHAELAKRTVRPASVIASCTSASGGAGGVGSGEHAKPSTR